MCDPANSKHNKVVAMAYSNVHVSSQVTALQKQVLNVYAIDLLVITKDK